MRPSPLDTDNVPPRRSSPPAQVPADPRRRSHWFFLTVIGVILAGVVFFVAGNWLVMPLVTYRSVALVPDLYGLDVAVAKRTLLDSGLVFVNDSTDHTWDYDVPANHVVSQDPPPYVAVKSGRGVRVTISRGPQLHPVPDVRNMSPTQARLILQQQFFDVGTVAYTLRTNEDRSESFVTAQDPSPGSMVSRGMRVRLDISVLPEMPDLTGRSLEEAKRYLQALGLRLGSIQQVQDDDLLPRSVVGQSVPPRRRIHAGDTVDLTVSHL